MPPQPTDRQLWDGLTWIIGLCAITGRIEGVRPQSLMIVGPPSSGKSELMLRYRPQDGLVMNPNMLFATSASSWGLSNILQNRVPQGVTHFVAPELQTLIKRKSHVWDAFVGLMLPAMEEGVTDIYNGPHRKRFHGARMGLITALPDDAYDENFQTLESCGLLSRLLVVRFQRTNENVLAARKAYNHGDHSELRKVDLELPKHMLAIAIAPSVADHIDLYAASLNTKEVHRASNRFTALTKAVAWLDGKAEATVDHFEALKTYERFWRF